MTHAGIHNPGNSTTWQSSLVGTLELAVR